MANQHAHKQRVIRGVDDELISDFDAAAKASGADRSAITRQLWAWFARRDGAELPERPPKREI
ncbi:hypothetical protein Kisp02_54150 [Kineosporia sp. NBRC 101731]|nr:hypothetical protein Kisp02_54150 [Kineosporia sp. NBRC 101731]